MEDDGGKFERCRIYFKFHGGEFDRDKFEKSTSFFKEMSFTESIQHEGAQLIDTKFPGRQSCRDQFMEVRFTEIS